MNFGNTIAIEGKIHRLWGEPLEQYWTLHKNKPRICFSSTSPLDKGYYAHWLLQENKLYLSEFQGQCLFHTETRYCLEDIFPSTEPPVFAEWYNGELKIQTGNIVKTPNMVSHHFGQMREDELQMNFINGVLISTETHYKVNSYNHEPRFKPQ